MAAPQGLGTNSVTLGTPNTIRLDISEILLANLILANNFAGSLRVGPEFNDTVCRWTEDRLNANTITDTFAGGQSTSSTQLLLSQADVSLISVGSMLMDVSSAAGGIGGGEVLTVNSVTSATGVVGVNRAANGSSATTHAQGAIYQIIGKPTAEFTDLGPDTSRARIPKWNYVMRQEINISLSAEVIERSLGGYTPGIPDELEYQVSNRVQELLRLWNTSFLYSRPFTGTNGTVGVSGGDYSSFGGLRAWMDGSMNALFSPSPTTQTWNWASLGWATGAIDTALNTVNMQLNRNGSVPDWAAFGFNGAQAASRLYNDRIRITQSENERGFSSDVMHTTLGNEVLYLLDGYIVDTATIGEVYVMDSERFRIRPLRNQWFYGFTAPTLRDGDSFRALSKCSFEARNTATDSGQASGLVTNASF